MDGILNINKPEGRTSFSLVAMVKRLMGIRCVGHAGTLDPAASGVLPVCLGQGTRVTEFLAEATKTYRAEIELGVTTDTYDASGQVTETGDPSGISRQQLTAALTSFQGLIDQTPPVYSAVKYQGKPLYHWARSGIKVTPKSRLVQIYHLELIDFRSPLVTIEIVCGKGTYIRSLAHDLGKSLGCGANLKSLVRLRCGPFDIKDAVSPEQLVDAFHHGHWQELVLPIDIALRHWPAMVVSDAAREDIRHGRPLALENVSQMNSLDPASPRTQECCRAYASGGQFLGILIFNPETRQWQPKKVFSPVDL